MAKKVMYLCEKPLVAFNNLLVWTAYGSNYINQKPVC